MGLIRNAITSRIMPFCREQVSRTATPSRAITMLISPSTRPET